MLPSVLTTSACVLAALEQRRAVNAGQNADFAVNRTDVVVASAVQAGARQDQFADGDLFELVGRCWKSALGGLGALFLGDEFLFDLVEDGVDGGGAVLLAGGPLCLLEGARYLALIVS